LDNGEGSCQTGNVFPSILSPALPCVNFVELKEFFLQMHTKILQAPSEYGAVLFKGSNAESVIYLSDLYQLLLSLE
jgi:hypothetical protein